MRNRNKTNYLCVKTFLHRTLLLLLIVLCIVPLAACGDNGKKIEWADLILGEKLPEIADAKGKIGYNNTSQELDLEIHNITETEYNKYIEACKEKGFTIDDDTLSSSFAAYNPDGYKLYLSYYSNSSELHIGLDAPMEMDTISWPAGTAGKMLPVPKSTIGKFNYEHDDNFSVYIGNTTKEEFWEYVNMCSEKGFDVDYSKGDNHYYAYNSDGWYLTLNYEGFNIIRISINAPDEETAAPTESSTEKTTEKKAEEATEKKESNATGIDPNFKAAMDSYEEFMDDYVAFMKKYNANPNDLTLLTDYFDYLDEYADMVKEFDKWEDEDLNNEEMDYYLEVQTRVTQKLLEVN